MEPPSFLRASTRMGPLTIVCGLCRLDSLALAPDYLHLGFLVSLRESACLESVLPLLSLGRSNFPLSTRSLVHLDLSLLIVGVAAIKGDAAIQDTVSVQGAMQVGLPCFAFGVVCFGSLLVVLDLVSTESFALLQTACHLELVLFASGCGRLGALTPLLEVIHAEVSAPMRGTSCPSSTPLVLGCARADPFALLPDLAYSEALLLARRLFCIDSLPFLVGRAQSGSVMLVLDLLHCESLLSVRSLACSGPSTSAFSFASPGFPFLLRAFSCLGVALIVFGRFWTSSSAFPLDAVNFGSFLFARASLQTDSAALLFGLSWLGLLLPTADLLHLDSSLVLKTCVQSGSTSPNSGRCYTDAFLLTSDPVSCDPSLPAQSLSCLALAVFCLDFASYDPLLPLHSSVCLGLSSLACGACDPESSSPPPDCAFLGSMLPLQYGA